MANTPANSTNNAGIVVVELRADLTQLEAGLKQAAGKVDAFAKGTQVSNVTAPQMRTETEGVRELTRAQEQLRQSAEDVRRARQADAFAARNARRDAREEIALLKDDIGDFASFNGQTIADRIFGFDRDKIRLGRLGQEIGDIKAQIARGILSEEEGRRLIAPLDLEKQGIVRKWSDARGAIRGLGATLTSSLASSFLIGGGLTIATTAIQALVNSGGKLVDAFVNPMKAAAAAADALATSIKEVGGVTQAANILGLTPEETKALMAFMDARKVQTAVDLYGSYDKLQAEAAALGMTPEELTQRDLADQRTRDRLSGEASGKIRRITDNPTGNFGLNILGIAGMGLVDMIGGLFGTDAAGVLGGLRFANGGGDAGRPGSQQELTGITDRQKAADALNLLRQGKTVSQEQLSILLSMSDEQSKQLILSQQKVASERDAAGSIRTQLQNLEAQRAMATNDLLSNAVTPAQRQVMIAQSQLNALQAKQQDLQKAQTDAGFQRTLNQAAAEVSRARARTAGMTAFEVQANVIEAKLRQAEVKEQVATQKEQAKLLGQIAKATKDLASAQQAEKLESIDKTMKELKQQLDFSQLEINMNGEKVGHITAPTVYSDIKNFERYGTGS